VPSLSFLNPAFLWTLPLAAIPVIIHLLSRRRLPEVSFPTTQFLRDLEPREIRRLRLREILLLILRTLAILLLALAFARPTLTPSHTVTHAAAAVAIVLDDSESMGALDDHARPRIQAARERASTILDAGRPGDQMILVTATRPEAGATERTADRVRLTRSLGQIEATSLPARMPEAIEAARRALERSTLKNRELYLVSDLQRSNFDERARGQIQAAARTANLYVVPLVESRVPNHAFLEVDPLLRPGPQNRGMELRARIANHADAPSDRLAIRIRRGDALIGGGDVTLRSDETKWAAMPVDWRAADAGAELTGEVLIEADEDALASDDRWYAVLGAPGRLRVLRITEARDGAPMPRFSALALDPGQDGRSGFMVENGTPASLLSLHRNRADVVLLEDVASISGDAEARLREFLFDALVGGLLTLILFGQEASLYAFVGMFMLMGIVKKNGIMIVDFARHRVEAGEAADKAIHDASMDRFRPILMTTLAAVFGAVPIALGYGADGSSRRPLGLVVVGGLVVSQFITLYITPVIYLYLEEFQEKVLDRTSFFRSRRSQKPTLVEAGD